MHFLFLLILIRLEHGLLNNRRIYSKNVDQMKSGASEEFGIFRAAFLGLAKRYPFPRREPELNKNINNIELHLILIYPLYILE